MNLILVRHGESVGNFENRLQGHADYELTDLGREQARLTAGPLSGYEPAAVYTSPLKRAAESAAIIGQQLDLEPIEVAEISEYSFGEFSGQTYAELRQRFQTSVSAGQTAEGRVYPGEEGRQAFFDRVTTAMWRVITRHAERPVVMVSHGGPIALFCQTVLGLPYRRPMPFSIANCSLTRIEADHRQKSAQLVVLNDTRHLYSLAPA